MSYQLKIDEMMEALTESNHPRAAQIQTVLEGLANSMAVELADHLGIEAGVGSFEGLGFAGTCVPFFPKTPDQPLPDVFASNEFDDADEWEEAQDNLGLELADQKHRAQMLDAGEDGDLP